MRTTLFLIFVLTSLQSYCQSVSNVVSAQQGDNAVVTYDLNGTVGTTYYVKLFYSTDNGLSFSNELMQVAGDVKGGVKAGTGKKITWFAGKEINYLNGPVVFKVEAEARKQTPKPVTIENTTVEIVSAKRNGDELIIEFTVNQNTDKEVKEFGLLRKSQLTTQDGRQVDPTGGKFGTKNMDYGGAYNVECPKGVPTRGVLIFKTDSPDLVIPSVKISLYSSSGSENFVIRNVPVQ